MSSNFIWRREIGSERVWNYEMAGEMGDQREVGTCTHSGLRWDINFNIHFNCFTSMGEHCIPIKNRLRRAK